MKKPIVGIVMGSNSDLEVMKEASNILHAFEVSYEMRVISAHRTPEIAADYAKKASARGLKVIIAGAGAAAHLAGVLSAGTNLPVIGVPLANSALNGMDSLLSTVQMPGGVPVATMGIGASGARNAGLLAIRILALNNEAFKNSLREYKKTQHRKVEEADQLVREQE